MQMYVYIYICMQNVGNAFLAKEKIDQEFNDRCHLIPHYHVSYFPLMLVDCARFIKYDISLKSTEPCA